MGAFKKYDGSVWQSINPKQLKGVPYTGTLPAVLAGTKAGYLHRYKVYGNLTQSGTPTPENPIVPSECGERTENLFDGEYPGYAVGSTIKYRPIYVGQGTFTLSTTFPQMTDYGDLFFLAGNVSTGASTGNDGVWSERPITVESIDGYVTIAYRRFSASHPVLRDYETMLNLGTTALPYEPYGYKLPLRSAGQDVDIYLGEVGTTRRIGKIDLGTLNWGKTASGNFWSATTIPNIRIIGNASTNNAICDTFKEVMSNDVANQPYSFSSCLNNVGRPFINKTGFEDLTAEEFKQAMSGVYMYYVLATEETGTRNEPLRKIGNYADTIDSTQTSVQIPTTANSTTISWAGSGLAPTQFDSIAEWVDTTPKIYTSGAWTDAQTYTYDDGAWVADN